MGIPRSLLLLLFSYASTAAAAIISFQQKLDHFDPAVTDTWSQNVYYNTDANPSNMNGVNLIYIGGDVREEGLDADQTLDQLIHDEKFILKTYARQFSANLYAIEHRFFGTTLPKPDTTTANLAQLNTQQAIEDVADFIKSQNAKANSPQKWIAFGRGYSGNLALWLRERHPEVVVGAYASSAPLDSKFDFYEYIDQVEQAIKDWDAAQAQPGTCAQTVRGAFQTIGQSIQTSAGRTTLNTDLVPNPLLDTTDTLDTVAPPPNNVIMLYQKLIDPWITAVKLGTLGDATKSINAYCTTMTAAEPAADSPVKRLKTILAGNLDIDFDAATIALQDGTNAANTQTRAWKYLLCNELGLMKTTDGQIEETDIFGSVIPSRYFVDECSSLFQIPADNSQLSVSITQQYYGGGTNYKGTNAIIANAEADPNFALFSKVSVDGSVVVYPMKGVSRGQDFLTNIADDDPNKDKIVYAQTLAKKYIQRWLDDPEPTRPCAICKSVISKSHPVSKLEDQSRPMRYGNAVYWPPDSTQNTIDQPIDHFNNIDYSTYKQKFFASNKYAAADGPNFLWIGGQSPLKDPTTDDNTPLMQYAQASHAQVYALEHRYYGESIMNFDQHAADATTDLKYLSSEQALEDIANFIRVAREQSPAKGPWVLFGSKYAGGLAVSARVRYPDLVDGAVVSSAITQPKANFFEYLEMVETALKGVSQDCIDNTKAALSEIRRNTFSQPGRTALKTLFNILGEWNGARPTEDIEFFFMQLFNAIQYVVENNGNNDGRDDAHAFTTDDLCRYMTDATVVSITERLKNVYNWVNDITPASQPLGITFDTYTNALNILKQNFEDINHSADDRAVILRLYQSCNELGLFTTTDGSTAFASLLPVNLFSQACSTVFGVNYAVTERAAVAFGTSLSNRLTNIIATHGGLDPYTTVTITTPSLDEDGLTTIVIPNRATASDIYPLVNGDTAMQTVLQTIQDKINRIVTVQARTTSSTSTSTTSHTTTTTWTTTSTTANTGTTSSSTPPSTSTSLTTPHTTASTHAPTTSTASSILLMPLVALLSVFFFY